MKNFCAVIAGNQTFGITDRTLESNGGITQWDKYIKLDADISVFLTIVLQEISVEAIELK